MNKPLNLISLEKKTASKIIHYHFIATCNTTSETAGYKILFSGSDSNLIPGQRF